MASKAGPSMSTSKKRKFAAKDSEIISEVLDEVLDDSGSDFEINLSDSDYVQSDSDSDLSEVSENEESEDRVIDGVEKRRGGHHTNLNMNWVVTDFMPQIHKFDNSRSGVNNLATNDDSKEIDYFLSLLTPEIVNITVQETNRYAVQKLQDSNLSPTSYLRKWKNIDIDEMYVFVAILMLNSCNKKRDLKLQWSTDPLLHTPIFGRTMPRDRFLSILSMLHLTNNEDHTPEVGRLYKVKDVLDRIKQAFKAQFSPFQDLVIDESMVLFKGRLIFKQYIKTKRHRFGIKLYVLCDCETGYVLDFIVYTGAETEMDHIPDLGASGSIVVTLMQQYLNKGHSLFTDNYYTSPTLSLYLHDKKTNSCGTVRQNRKHMPPLKNKLQKGEIQSKATDKLLGLKWQDRREVTMLTTMHKNEMVTLTKRDRKTNQFIKKPSCVVEYNEKMGAVDRSDMMLSSVECVRKSTKWYKKLYFHAIDLCLLNAHALYLTKTGNRVPLSKFQLNIIRQLLEKFHTPTEKQRKGKPSGGLTPLRLTERHFPSLVPPTPKRKNAMRKCIVCTQTKTGQKKRKESRVMCEPCDVGLCIAPCFAIFHTKSVF